MRRMVAFSCATLLAACASPPEPPTVDGSNRITVNTPETTSVLSLRAELGRSQDRVRELEAKPAPIVVPAPLPASQTLTVYFPFNVATFRPSTSQEAALLPLLADVQRVEVRGRTDAARPSAADERIALMRAQSAKNYLLAHGVPATKVSVNYVSGGDYVADSDSAIGRARNRRVEIEVFNQKEKQP